MKKLDKKVAIVSGASSGIGRAIAHKLAGENFSLGLNSRVRTNLDESVEGLDPSRLSLTVGDVSNPELSKMFVAETVNRFGGIQTAIVNAGVGYFGSFLDIPESRTKEIVQTNLLGSIYFAQAVIPELLRNEMSNLIFVSSTAGTRGGANEAIYSSTKHAQNGLAGSIDREFRSQGLRVTIIAPGATSTNFAAGFGRDPNDMSQNEFLSPSDVADAVHFAMTMPTQARIQYLSILPQSQSS